MVRASREFQTFAKPAGALCNLDCAYCYYLKRNQLDPERGQTCMPDDVLEAYIVQQIEASPGEDITFSWHGGEPTILGLGYFRRIAALQRKHRPAGRRIVNGIQTNGILLDEEWCRFFREERYGVGLSLDGPAEMHDRYRVTRGRQPSHRQVMRAYNLMRRLRVPCDILCAVHDCNVRYPTQVYRYFKEIGASYIGFLPVVEPRPGSEGGVSPQTVPADAFGEFLCRIFDEWVRQDAGRVMVQIFDEASRPARGLEHSLCIFRETCGDIPVVERSGDIYSCDHYVDAEHRLGNILSTPLGELIESPAQGSFGRAKRDLLPRYCLNCDVRPMCNGGCPKDRFLRTPDGDAGLNYLCAGFRRFFTHSLPVFVRMASMGPVANDSRLLQVRTVNGDGVPAAGRNEPCPCGSGRKYKRCCLRI